MTNFYYLCVFVASAIFGFVLYFIVLHLLTFPPKHKD